MSKTKPPDDENEDEADGHSFTDGKSVSANDKKSDDSLDEDDGPGRAGQQVDKYRLERRLGAGGMAEVYVAVRTDHIQNRVALKLLHSYFASRQDYRRRFEQEALILSTLNHPGIVKIVDYGVLPSGESFLAMEYLEGTSLAERLAQSPGHRLPIDAAVHLGYQVACALASAHQRGVVHRDLKPSNLMIVPDSAAWAGERVKIVDFGIARTIEASGEALTEVGKIIGTMRYMSPEQLRGEKVDGSTDVFALGLVLFEMIAGRPAFTGNGSVLKDQILREEAPNLRTVQHEVPRPLSDLVRRMLAKVATDRPTMTQLEQELSQLSLTGSRSAIRTVSPSRLFPLSRTTRTVIAVLLGCVVSVGIGVAVVRSLKRPVEPATSVAIPEAVVHSAKPPVVSATTVRIPEGDMLMGSTPEQVQDAYSRCRIEMKDAPKWCRPDMFENEQPQRAVHIRAFQMDRSIANTADFVRFLHSVRSRLQIRPDSQSGKPRFVILEGQILYDLHSVRATIVYNAEKWEFSALQRTEEQPVEQATWFGAEQYCRSNGKRLITEVEWEYVAKLLETPEGRAKLPGRIDLPADIQEWVWDEYKALYPDCHRCTNPVVGKPPDQRKTEDASVVRGCDRALEPAVCCRSAARTKRENSAAATKLGFRCVSDG